MKYKDYKDQEEILRIDDQLRHANIINDKKYQILLPNQHHISKWIAKYLHITNVHVKPQTLLSTVSKITGR